MLYLARARRGRQGGGAEEGLPAPRRRRGAPGPPRVAKRQGADPLRRHRGRRATRDRGNVRRRAPR